MTHSAVESALASLLVTRLAHFTPSRNVTPILQDGLIRSSKDLANNSPEFFSPTDHERYDAHPNHVCCSFEYPNAYYLKDARKKPDYWNYPDWVCFLLDRQLAAREGTLFSGCNAGYAHGAHLAEGAHALEDLWADPSKPRGRPRQRRHNPAVPTDLQAEALIPGPIDLSYVGAIVVEDSAIARELFSACRRLGLSPDRFRWKVAPTFFRPYELRDAIWTSATVREIAWEPEGAP